MRVLNVKLFYHTFKEFTLENGLRQQLQLTSLINLLPMLHSMKRCLITWIGIFCQFIIQMGMRILGNM